MGPALFIRTAFLKWRNKRRDSLAYYSGSDDDVFEGPDIVADEVHTVNAQPSYTRYDKEMSNVGLNANP